MGRPRAHASNQVCISSSARDVSAWGPSAGKQNKIINIYKRLWVMNAITCTAFFMFTYTQKPKKSTTSSPISAPNTGLKNCGEARNFSFVCKIFFFWRSGRSYDSTNVNLVARQYFKWDVQKHTLAFPFQLFLLFVHVHCLLVNIIKYVGMKCTHFSHTYVQYE